MESIAYRVQHNTELEAVTCLHRDYIKTASLEPGFSHLECEFTGKCGEVARMFYGSIIRLKILI